MNIRNNADDISKWIFSRQKCIFVPISQHMFLSKGTIKDKNH